MEGHLQDVKTINSDRKGDENKKWNHFSRMKPYKVKHLPFRPLTNTLVAYVFCVLTYGNWEHHGNLTIILHLKRHWRQRWCKLVVRCLNHKTAGAYGPTVMVLKECDAHVLRFYLNVVRPTLASSATCDNELALVTVIAGHYITIETLCQH